MGVLLSSLFSQSFWRVARAKETFGLIFYFALFFNIYLYYRDKESIWFLISPFGPILKGFLDFPGNYQYKIWMINLAIFLVLLIISFYQEFSDQI